jgi:hypothetical protein
MRSLYLVVGLTLLFKISANAQITSAQSGPWNQGSTWVGGVIPTSGTVNIVSTHAINIPSGYAATAGTINVSTNTLVSPLFPLTIDNGGSLSYTTNLQLGTITTRGRVLVNGTFNLEQGATITGGIASVGRLTIGATGTYKLNYTTTPGVVYTAAWNTGSTLEIAGYTSNTTPPAGLNQAFSNFKWNCVNQQNDFYLAGTLTNVTGNFSVVAPTASWVFGLTNTGSNLTLAIGGSLTLSPDVFLDLNGGSGNTTVNLLGDFNMSTDDAVGNFGSGAAVINFRNTSVAQSYNSPNNISSPVDFAVFTGTTLNIPEPNSIQTAGGFSLASGATLGVASVDGLVTGQALGAIRTFGARSYAVGGNIIYNGSLAQTLGDEWGSGGGLDGVQVNLEINNTSTTGVTNNIIGSTNLVGRLRLTRGSLNIGNSNSLIISGDFEGFASPTLIGTVGGHTSNTSSLEFGGSGTVTGTLNFTAGANTLRNLSINRANDVTLGSNLTIATTGTLSFPESGNLHIDGQTLTVNGNITQAGSGGFASAATTTNLVIGGSGALSALPFCIVCGTNNFNNVTLNRTGGATYTWNSTATINGILNISAGSFTHTSGLTMATGSTLRRNSGTTYAGSTPNATTRYNLSYVGNLTTSAELPTTAQDRLADLTVAGTVTLDKPIIINGNLSITSGILQANTRNITMKGTLWAINGGQFTINAANSVTFASGTTTVMSGSTINDAQFGAFVINSGSTVQFPSGANINVAGLWTISGNFLANNGTVTFNGTTQSINPNGQAFFNLETANGTKTLTGALVIGGGLDINTGSTLAAGTNTINIAGLWDNNGTFTPGTGTVVFDGTTQSIDNASQAFNAITFANSGTKTLAANLEADGALAINSGVTLDVSVNNYNLLAGAAFTNNGTFNPRLGTVTFDGGLPQNVSGTTNTQFYNITQTNATSVSITSGQSIVNALTLSAGTFNPNGNFTLISTASGDARINDLTSGGTIGNSSMIVQRYLPNTAGLSVARYLSSPVSNAMMSQWKDDFPITGPISDHSTVAEWVGQGISPYPFNETNNSIQIYNEAKTPTTNLNDRYVGYPTTGTLATTPLVAGVGYNVRPRVTAAITPEVVGRPNFGPVSVTVTAQGVTVNDGWNLVGNPYPSPINWNNVTRPSGLSAQIALTDNTNNIGTGAGNFIYYTAGGTGIPVTYTGTIAQGQAFWVRKTTVGSASLTFQEDDKQATSTPPFVRQAEDDILRVNVAGNGISDELVILFADDAQDIFESEGDAAKLANPVINFYSMSSDNKDLAINTMGALGCSREIPLVLKGVSSGTHIFKFSQLETFSDGIDIRLLDAFTGQTFVVTEANASYNFSVTSDPNSFGAGRFKVYVGYKDLDLSMNLQSADGCNGSDAQIKIIAPQKGVSYYATVNGSTVSEKFIATGSELTVTIPAANLTQDESTVVLKAQNGTCAEMPLTQSATIKKNGIPTVSQVSEATGCGESSVTLTANGAPDGGSYRWYLAEDATDAIAGQTASAFTTPSLAKTKTYFVSAVSISGCEGSRVPVTATISYVDQATITEQNGVLVSNSDAGNQWYLNGQAITGATTKTYKPAESGVYRLVVTTGACSSQVEQEYAVTGDINGDKLKGYVLYPNPSSGTVYVEVATTNEVRVSIVNGVGKEITRGDLKLEGDRRKGQFDITGQAAGVYLVVIKNDKETVTRKIMKN